MKEIFVDVATGSVKTITATEQDNLNETYKIILKKNEARVDLTDKNVKMILINEKIKFSTVLDLPIIDAKSGELKLQITDKITFKSGILNCQLGILGENGFLENTGHLSIYVKESLFVKFTELITSKWNFGDINKIIEDAKKFGSEFPNWEAFLNQVKKNEDERIEAEKRRDKKIEDINSQVTKIENDFDEAIANVTNGNESATNSEIVQARGGEVNLNKRLDKFDTQLSENENKLDKLFTSLEINVKNPPAPLEPCLGDGSDETNKIQACINYLNASNGSGMVQKQCGTLKFPTGVYGVRNLTMKSNINVIGEGVYNTRFKPLSDTGFIFDTALVSNGTRIANVNYRDFTIAPTTNFTEFETDEMRTRCGGINVSHSTNVNIDNVGFYNIDGINILSVEQFDASINRVTIMYSKGDDYAFKLTSGDGDLTNAVHINQLRVKQCAKGLGLFGEKYRQVREIQFVACKFEECGISIKGCNSIIFASSHFTIKDGYKITIESVENTDSRGINFIGCTSVSANSTGTFIENISGVNINICGCSFSNIKTIAKGKNFMITGLTSYDLKGNPLEITNSIISNAKIHFLNSDLTSSFGNCKIANLETSNVLFKGEVSCINSSIDKVTTSGQNNSTYMCDIKTHIENGSANEITRNKRFRGSAINDLLLKGHIFWVGSRLAVRTSNDTIKYITLTD